MAALCNRGHYISALWFLSFFFLFFLAQSQRSEIGCLLYLHTWYGLSAKLKCMPETCCTRLDGNAGRKNDAKNRHLGTIAQVCRVISSQLRHVSTIGKKLVRQQYLLHMSLQYGELRPTIAAEIISLVWNTPVNFNGFRVLAALLHGTPVLGVRQTLRH